MEQRDGYSAPCSRGGEVEQPDHRHEELGLSEAEASYIRSVCRRYASHRDPLEELYQTCLVALFEGFERAKAKNTPIHGRKGFIRRVVTNILNYRYLQEGGSHHKGSVDLIYRALNTSGTWRDIENTPTTEMVDLSVEYADGSERHTPMHLVTSAPDLTDLDRTIAIRQIMEATLTAEECRLLRANEVEGYSQKELAQELGTTQGKISLRIGEARAKLMKALLESMSEEDLFG